MLVRRVPALAGLALLALIAECDGQQLFDECDKTSPLRRRCIRTLPSTGIRSEEECKNDGCYHCPIKRDKCLEGFACLNQNVAAEFECRLPDNNIITSPRVCFDQNCSWCARNVDINKKCLKRAQDPQKFEVPAVPPPPVDGTCGVDFAARRACPRYMTSLDSLACWHSGCFWCPLRGRNKRVKGAPSCIEGKPCAQGNIMDSRYDCRLTPNEAINPKACRYRGCSWCDSNTVYKCVRAIPANPTTCAMAATSQLCYPFNDPSITSAQCTGTGGCTYCPSPLSKTCIREECPPGTVPRYGGQGCCNSANNQRIIGGQPATLGRWPFQVAYEYANDAFCGGTIVTATRVLTAAHCVDNTAASFQENVRYGALSIMASTRVDVSSSIAHENYDFNNGYSADDIKILTLAETLVFSSTVQAISFPKGEVTPVGMSCYVAGWGDTVSGTSSSPVNLLEVDVLIRPMQECQINNLFNPTPDANIQICAGHPLGGKDSCQGDSGGPLMCQRCRNCDWYLAGIVSYGEGCALPNKPAIYTRVEGYKSWMAGKGLTIANMATHDCNLY